MFNTMRQKFIEESNRIEGIYHEATDEEINIYADFLNLGKITITDLKKFVSLIQPNAVLRNKVGLNVRVGQHVPLPGGPNIELYLKHLLIKANSGEFTAYDIHREYETLHPFTDGNGRSGRILWLWMMGGEVPGNRGFLHQWYYQSLDASRGE